MSSLRQRSEWCRRLEGFMKELQISHAKGWFCIDESFTFDKVIEKEVAYWQSASLCMRNATKELGSALVLKGLPMARIVLLLFVFKSRYICDLVEEFQEKDIVMRCSDCCSWKEELAAIKLEDEYYPKKYNALAIRFVQAHQDVCDKLRNDPECFEHLLYLPEEEDTKHNEEEFKPISEPLLRNYLAKNFANLDTFRSSIVDTNTFRNAIYDVVFKQFKQTMESRWQDFETGKIQFLMDAFLTVQLTIRCRHHFNQDPKQCQGLAKKYGLSLLELDIVEDDLTFEDMNYPISFIKQRNQDMNVFLSCKIKLATVTYTCCLAPEIVFCLFGENDQVKEVLLRLS